MSTFNVIPRNWKSKFSKHRIFHSRSSIENRQDSRQDDAARNRWIMIAPAFASHLCIGSPYAWSALSGTLCRELGFVCSAANDWTLTEATIPLSIVFALQGISAAIAAKWQMKVGIRHSMLVSAACFGGGLMVGGIGIHFHSLTLLYLGYGILGGTGVGLGYTPPLQALLEWFPDKKGLASGLCIAGFGSGALLFTPVCAYLMTYFSKLPTYVGSTSAIEPMIQDGKLFVQTGDSGSLSEVMVSGTSPFYTLRFVILLLY